ncbi:MULTISPECIES: hypothetical protein [unclassified Tenacibaculum]|uniref:hypothetical protein n=1 Tax=unclassified Tenacibaculum TaxID=2635139 RepID=UPI001F3B5D0E|nr:MULTISPECIES: hypothetical protein [unclassified Tenacibaculum]MCF2875420.1 hypothetical protein [Tenacibaculum sp. Cn5-1]MCF2935496.1 hypothetical protein [Tenacibaculum sp. Cn5-34]MCG7512056.1 hypothetical protein [Tenacibaculum sp. Cn5-46]
MNIIIEDNKVRPYLRKCDFYNFFIDYVTDHDSMKREISEIVSKNRKMSMKRALNIRNFRIREVKEFIKLNDLQDKFIAD